MRWMTLLYHTIPFAFVLGCSDVNHVNNQPGHFSCDCVSFNNPCLEEDGGCVLEERCPESDGESSGIHWHEFHKLNYLSLKTDQNCIYILLNFYISALKCYQGTGDSAVMSSCSGSPTPDRCIKETNSGVVTFACDLASNINGSVTDNACSTINSVEICICSTDGCHEPPGNF